MSIKRSGSGELRSHAHSQSCDLILRRVTRSVPDRLMVATNRDMREKRIMKASHLSSVAAASPDPVDVIAASRLRECIARFNADAEGRSKLSATDRTQLAELRAAANHLGSFHSHDWSGATEQLRGEILTRTESYDGLSTGEAESVVNGQTYSHPAIESAHFRSLVQRLGAEVLALIDQFIAARRNDVERGQANRRAEEEAVDQARDMPVLAPLITAYEQAGVAGLGHLQQDIRRSIEYTANEFRKTHGLSVSFNTIALERVLAARMRTAPNVA